MKNARKPLPALIALGAALAMPLAFAQDPTTTQPPTSTEYPTQQTPPTATEQGAESAKPLTWADLDVDGNGTLSKEEAGTVQSLAQVFDEADSDQDGELTPDEYRAYAAKAAPQSPGASGGND